MKALKTLIGLVLLPAVPASVATLGALAQAMLPDIQSPAWWGLATGAMLWALWALLLPLPERAYILGHELTHAFWTLCMGGRIGRMRVGRKGGYVEISKSNIWIALSPYFFPFYTWVVLSVYGIYAVFQEPVPGLPLWMAAMGWTWAFHVTFTVRFLMLHQPDIQEHGRVLSYTLILLANVVGLSFWIALVGSPSLVEWCRQSLGDLEWAYGSTWAAAQWMLSFILP